MEFVCVIYIIYYGYVQLNKLISRVYFCCVSVFIWNFNFNWVCVYSVRRWHSIIFMNNRWCLASKLNDAIHFKFIFNRVFITGIFYVFVFVCAGVNDFLFCWTVVIRHSLVGLIVNATKLYRNRLFCCTRWNALILEFYAIE